MSLLPAAAEPPPARRALSAVPDEREELAALHQTSLELIERLDLDGLLETIVDRAGGLVGTPHGYLYAPARTAPCWRYGSAPASSHHGLAIR